jgi:hypothetical protein
MMKAARQGADCGEDDDEEREKKMMIRATERELRVCLHATPPEAVGCEHNWRRRTCDSRGFLCPKGEGKLEGSSQVDQLSNFQSHNPCT